VLRSGGNASVERDEGLLWDETSAGETKGDAPVDREVDSICRTAVYVIRMYGGVGGAGP
jgi:hypothetical protein